MDNITYDKKLSELTNLINKETELFYEILDKYGVTEQIENILLDSVTWSKNILRDRDNFPVKED